MPIVKLDHLYSLIKGESHGRFDIGVLCVQLWVRLHSLAGQRFVLIGDEREAVDIAQLYEVIA